MSQPTKSVYVDSQTIPTVDDVMALVHKLSYHDLISFAALISADVAKLANGAEDYQYG